MEDHRTDELLLHARELERRDADVAARLEDVTRLLRRVDEVRRRASETHTALAAIPEEIEHGERAQRDAQAREAEARRELADAEERAADLGRSRRAGDDARAAAERAVRRAAIATADAGATLARTQERLQALDGEELALRAAADDLAREARETAAAVVDVPRVSDSGRAIPGATLEEIEEWGARAHAALFVVRGGLENERERIVLEASTLAAAVLGEQVAGTNVALVRRRLEQSLPTREPG